MSKIGSSTLTSSTITNVKELWSRESEEISKEICPSGGAIIIHIFSDTALQFHLALIQIQKIRIKDLIHHDKI